MESPEDEQQQAVAEQQEQIRQPGPSPPSPSSSALVATQPPFIHQVTHSCQNLLLAVRALSSAAMTTDENAIVEGIQHTASAVVRISTLIEEAAEDHPDQPDYQILWQTAQDTREHVVAYIRHTRKAFANPLDYMTRQELDTTKKKVSTLPLSPRHNILIVLGGRRCQGCHCHCAKLSR